MADKRFHLALLTSMTMAAVCQAQSEEIERLDEVLPTPPAYSTDRLIPIEMPPYVTMKIGIDPKTIEVTADGQLRYVVVIRNPAGSVTVAFEGIHCAKGEFRTYARVNSSGAWVMANQSPWRNVGDSSGSRHALAIVQQGGCENVVGRKREDVINALKGLHRSHYAN